MGWLKTADDIVALATQHPGRLTFAYFRGIKAPKAVTLAVVAGVAAGLIMMSGVQPASGDSDETDEPSNDES